MTAIAWEFKAEDIWKPLVSTLHFGPITDADERYSGWMSKSYRRVSLFTTHKPRTGAKLSIKQEKNTTFSRRYLDPNRVTYEVGPTLAYQEYLFIGISIMQVVLGLNSIPTWERKSLAA